MEWIDLNAKEVANEMSVRYISESETNHFWIFARVIAFPRSSTIWQHDRSRVASVSHAYARWFAVSRIISLCMCGATLSKVQFSRRRRRRWRRRRAGEWADGEESFVLRRKRSSGSLGSAHNGDGVNFVDPAAVIATTGIFGGIWLLVIKRVIIKPPSDVRGTLTASDEITRRFDRLRRYSRPGIKSRWQFFHRSVI